MSEPSPFESVFPCLKAPLEARGFTSLTAVQQAVLNPQLSGKNLRISSQTGSGKTVAIGFMLAQSLRELIDAAEPATGRGPFVLLITPTRELAAQVCEELDWLYAQFPGYRSVVVTGGTDLGRERRSLGRAPVVVVGTPGRMLDHITSGALDCSRVAHVVLDEADQMLDMGFRDELDGIVDALPEARSSHLVSATFAPQVRRFADRFQGRAEIIAATELGAANEDIEHIAHVVHPSRRYDALVNCLLMVSGERCLVFVKRRCDAAELSERLAEDGFSTLPLSGDLPQAQRTRTLTAFRNGIVRTLIATDVAARGIDVAAVSTVIHFDMPEDGEAYTHRSGRTGRAGQKGRSLLLVNANFRSRIERGLRAAGIDATWSPVPSSSKIRKLNVKRARRAMHRALDSESTVDDQALAYARDLLAEHDPATLVARLLELTEPPLPREPFDIEAPQSRPAARRREAVGPGGYSPFAINWGRAEGANPSRIVAHLCRRTGISSGIIGAVDIGERETRFEIAATQAEQFAKRAQSPDPRDPHLVIEESRGSVSRDPDGGRPRGRRPNAGHRGERRFDSSRHGGPSDGRGRPTRSGGGGYHGDASSNRRTSH